MSSGSYFTIYRKHKSAVAPAEQLNALKEEYKKADEGLFGTSKKNDSAGLPVLMHESYSATPVPYDENENMRYYDSDGHLHEKLLEFHFGSSFTALKEHLSLNAYKFKDSAVLISRETAEKMLQAVNYVLSKNYSKAFEDVLDNEYADVFGNGYSPFDYRFSKRGKKLYIDKCSEGYTVSLGDEQLDRETAECDSEAEFSLKRVRSCLQAFLDAESNEWENVELVLEYSVY